MRMATSLLTGITIGVFASVTSLRLSPTMVRWVVPQPPTRSSSPGRQVPPEPRPVAVMRGELFFIRDSSGAAVIEPTDFGERTASYRWRARLASTGVEQHGAGALIERMESRRDGSIWLDRANSQTRIQAGPFSLGWSYRSGKSAWLYVKQEPPDAYVLDASFATFSLAPLGAPAGPHSSEE